MCVMSEAVLEDKLINQLADLGYEKVNVKDKTSMELNFRKQLNWLNKDKLAGIELSDKEFDRLLIKISGKSIFDNAKTIRDEVVIIRDNEDKVYLKLFDYNDWCRNKFQVTNQIEDEGSYKVRYDVTILINGLPMVQIELKRAGIEMKQAMNQINRYRKTGFTGLMRFLQLFIVSNGKNTRYFSNSDRKIDHAHMFVFTDFENNPINNIEEFTQFFLERCTIGKLIARYIVTNETQKALMVLRPYQINAVEELVTRATETNNNGYIWHTTGSGKTLTSFKTSQILSRTEGIDKVVFLVDRRDLDSQTLEEFNKFEKGSVDETNNTQKLVELFNREDKRLLITTIQKLSNSLKKDHYMKKMEPLRDKKIVFIIDECHRSQFGDMHRQIQKHFNNAQYLGFTGTPIFKQNKSQDGRVTKDLFEKCLHTYLVKDAIRDNNVLGWNVDYIKTFKGKELERKELDQKINGADYDEVYNHPDRQKLIAEHIAQSHNIKTRNKEYCAMFTVNQVKNVISYYKTFKEINHDLKIAAIYSFNANEDQDGVTNNSREELELIIKDYNKMFDRNYSTDTFQAYFADVSKKVKNGEIDILIVANMFLTGFDSKPLNTLYVDKNMNNHGLIQAFSRTNRVYTPTKQFGNIVCYRNLKRKVDEALALFSSTDGVSVTLVESYEFYLEEFEKYVNRLLEYVPKPENVDKLEREEDIAKFIYYFRDIARVHTKLSTFIEFDWNNEGLPITAQLYADFKSKYVDIKSKPRGEKDSILDGIDFELELILTSKINVSYLLDLLQEVHEMEDNEKKIKRIDEILQAIGESDNPSVMAKREFIENFLIKQMPDFEKDIDIISEFKLQEHEAMQKDIEEYSSKKNIKKSFIQEQIDHYSYYSKISSDVIKDYASNELGMKLKERRMFVKETSDFIYDITTKYE